jgi:hypothetical protein
MYASDGGNSDETPPDGSTVVGDATPIPIDGSMEASLGDGGEAGPCLGTLAQVASTFAISGRCPDTEADGIEAGLCGTNSFPNLRGSCGGLAMLGFNWGTHLQYCFYPGDGGALVAATAYDDQPSFCGGTSYTISSGSVVETGSAGASPIWSVSGQTCDMPAPTYFDCSPVDASGN